MRGKYVSWPSVRLAFLLLLKLDKTYDKQAVIDRLFFIEGEIHMEVHCADKYRVFFDGGFWDHEGRDHAGKAVQIEKEFQWAGKQWLVPAVYSCGKGLVLELCMRVNAEEIKAFMDKWDLTLENESRKRFSREQREEIDRDNPMSFDFDVSVSLNGKKLTHSNSCGVSFNPCLLDCADIQPEAEQVLTHYGLPMDFGWMISRHYFFWNAKRRPDIKRLSITMTQRPVNIPGAHFHASAPGDGVSFTLPGNETEHLLTVVEYERNELTFEHPDYMEYPSHCTLMSYTLTPELPEGTLTVLDCGESDRPRSKYSDSADANAAGAACMGVIGGADGPTAIVCGSERKKLHAAVSSLRFQSVKNIEWRMVFHQKQLEDMRVELL